RTLAGHRGAVTSLAFHPGGGLLASAGFDHTTILWNVETGAEVWRCAGHTFPVRALAFHPNGHLLATGCHATDNRDPRPAHLQLWEADTGKALRELPVRAGRIEQLAFSGDGTQLAAACGPPVVLRWDTSDYRELSPIRLHGEVRGLAFCA